MGKKIIWLYQSSKKQKTKKQTCVSANIVVYYATRQNKTTSNMWPGAGLKSKLQQDIVQYSTYVKQISICWSTLMFHPTGPLNDLSPQHIHPRYIPHIIRHTLTQGVHFLYSRCLPNIFLRCPYVFCSMEDNYFIFQFNFCLPKMSSTARNTPLCLPWMYSVHAIQGIHFALEDIWTSIILGLLELHGRPGMEDIYRLWFLYGIHYDLVLFPLEYIKMYSKMYSRK